MSLELISDQSVQNQENYFAPADEGQLSVDIFRDGNYLVVRSTVAGVEPEDLDIAIHGDLLTVRGARAMREEVNEDDWFYRECYWGIFSRSLVLPFDVIPERAEAKLKNGILEIRLPIRTQNFALKISEFE
jgi:HSP20 family protein